MGKLAIVKPQGEDGKAWPAICVGLFVAFGGVLFGYDTVRRVVPPSTHTHTTAPLAKRETIAKANKLSRSGHNQRYPRHALL